MTVNETRNYAQPPTIYPAPYYPIYKAWQTADGWVVVYLSDRYTMRPVDGGKVHAYRQHAYAKAQRLNHPIKYALKKTGMVEAEYAGALVNVQIEQQGEFADQYRLTVSNGTETFEIKHFATIAELEAYAKVAFSQPIAWHKVRPEEI